MNLSSYFDTAAFFPKKFVFAQLHFFLLASAARRRLMALPLRQSTRYVRQCRPTLIMTEAFSNARSIVIHPSTARQDHRHRIAIQCQMQGKRVQPCQTGFVRTYSSSHGSAPRQQITSICKPLSIVGALLPTRPPIRGQATIILNPCSRCCHC